MGRKAQFSCARSDIDPAFPEAFIDLAVSLGVLVRNEHKCRASGALARTEQVIPFWVQSANQPRDKTVVVRLDSINSLFQKILDRGSPRFEIKEVGRAEGVIATSAKIRSQSDSRQFLR